MESIMSVNTILFTLMGYQMSYLEFFGTIFNIWCVWLAARNKILNWPVGIVGIVLYIFLFYQIRLYSDFFEQIYFLVTSFWGWWLWARPRGKDEDEKNRLKVKYNTLKVNIIYALVILLGTIGLGYFIGHIHIYLPRYFPVPAQFVYLDAFTTVMSFAATILMAKKRVECWYLWIAVDIIGIGLYFAKEVKFISAEYVIFLTMATIGWLQWRKEVKGYGQKLAKAKLATA